MNTSVRTKNETRPFLARRIAVLTAALFAASVSVTGYAQEKSALDWLASLNDDELSSLRLVERPGVSRCDDDTDYAAGTWTPGQRHPVHPHVVASAKPGCWDPEPGYGWVDAETSWRVVWTPGASLMVDDDPAKSTILEAVAAQQEGTWEAQAGYRLRNPRDPYGGMDWIPGTEHPDHPHVFATENKNTWMPAPGYEWVPGADLEVRRKAVAAPAAAAGSPPSKIRLSPALDADGKFALALRVAQAASDDMADRSQTADMSSMLQTLASMPPQTVRPMFAAMMQTSGMSEQIAAAANGLGSAKDADAQRSVIVMEMLRCAGNDISGLEAALNRIQTTLDAQGSRIHKTGRLGEVWAGL